MGERFERGVRKLSNALDWVVGQVSVVLFGSMTLVVLVGVLFRYVLRMPLSWTEELSRYLMIWGASLAISTGIKYEEHVGLTVLLDSMKSRIARLILETLVSFLVLGFLAVMTFYSIQMVAESRYQIAQSLGISMMIPSLAVPVAMGIAVVQLILSYFLKIRRHGLGKHEVKIIDI